MIAIVFDLDGTLVDSAGDLRAAANRMLADLDLPPLDRETVIGFIGHGVEVLVRRVLVHSGAVAEGDAYEIALAAFRRYYGADLAGETRPYPGVVALLGALNGAGVKMGICTNKPEAAARGLCDLLDLTRHFDAIVGGDTLPVRKPDPEPLLHTLRLLGSSGPDTALYVGDSETDWLTAKAAGIPFVYFEGGYQRIPIAEFRPAHRVASMGEVAALVRRA